MQMHCPFLSPEQEWWSLHCCLLLRSLEECAIWPYGKAGLYKHPSIFVHHMGIRQIVSGRIVILSNSECTFNLKNSEVESRGQSFFDSHETFLA